MKSARNKLLDLEDLTEAELEHLKGSFTKLAGNTPDTGILREAAEDLDTAGAEIQEAREKVSRRRRRQRTEAAPLWLLHVHAPRPDQRAPMPSLVWHSGDVAVRLEWQLTSSGHASPSGSPSMRSPRHTDTWRRAVSRASSSYARTSHRDTTGCGLSASRAPLPSRRCRDLSGQRQPVHCLVSVVGHRHPDRTADHL